MAHALDLDLVAEGVESAGQLEFIRLRGVEMIQGYYFSPPVDAARFRAYLSEGPPLGCARQGHRGVSAYSAPAAARMVALLIAGMYTGRGLARRVNFLIMPSRLGRFSAGPSPLPMPPPNSTNRFIPSSRALCRQPTQLTG
ncbi:MAG: EAL domain-containing protein [gamma proteobacterium symbiont of Phacoides pectinatus]